MNPFLDPGWIRNALKYWAERLRQDPKDELAWRTLASVEELAWQAGVDVSGLPDLRPSARSLAAGLAPVADLEAHGLEVVWRDRLEGLRRQVEQMAAELTRLRDELRKEGPGC